MSRKVVLVTGGNTGLGFECCLALAKKPDMHVILAGRNQQRVDEAVAKVKAAAPPSTIVEAGLIDLASLASVRSFAQKLLKRKLQLFTVVCNGGVQVETKRLTADGFEETFGVNHLGHFLLVELLRERTQRIVMMSSETHDPAEKTGVPPPNVSDLDQLARGYDEFDNMEAYSTSKLCNLLFAKEFVRRYPNGPRIFAYTPGFTPDTGLFRERSWLLMLFLKPVIKFMFWRVGGRSSTPAYSGGYMAKLASEEPLVPNYANGVYIRVDEPWKTSKQAMDPKLGKELWEKSELWAGLK